jgi:hypothetical protein
MRIFTGVGLAEIVTSLLDLGPINKLQYIGWHGDGSSQYSLWRNDRGNLLAMGGEHSYSVGER